MASRCRVFNIARIACRNGEIMVGIMVRQVARNIKPGNACEIRRWDKGFTRSKPRVQIMANRKMVLTILRDYVQ